MKLTLEEIRMLLDLLKEKHGLGYSKDENVARLQAKLSMMGEIEQSRERERARA